MRGKTSQGEPVEPVTFDRLASSSGLPFLLSILNSLPQAISFVDPAGRYLLVNDLFARRAGLTAAECLGKTDRDLFPERVAASMRVQDLRVLQGDEPKADASEVGAIGGSRRDHTVVRTLVRNEGAILGVVRMEDVEEGQASGPFSAPWLVKVTHGVNLLLAQCGSTHHLAQGICDFLIQCPGITGARIVLLPEGPDAVQVFGAGNTEALALLKEKAQTGFLPACCEASATAPGTLVITDRTGICQACPTVRFCEKGQSLCTTLAFREQLLGYFALSLEPQFTMTETMKQLSFELTAQVSFTLHSLAQEKLLAKSKNMLRDVIDHCPSLIYVVDAHGRFLLANKRLGDLFGLSPQELIGKTRAELLPLDVVASHARNDQLVLSSGQPQMFEERTPTAGGEHLFLTVKFPLFDTAGTIVSIGGISTDITDRHNLTQALSRSRGELLAIYENAPIMMCVLNQDCDVLYANRAFSEFAGITDSAFCAAGPGQILGCINAREVAAGCGHGSKCRECPLRAALVETIRTGRSCRDFDFHTTLCWGEETREVVLHGSTAMIKYQEDANLLLCLEDITDRRMAEEDRDRAKAAFFQAQKMEAFGRLAGGIAHDFNNLLSVILGYCDLLQNTAMQQGKGILELKNIRQAAEQAVELTRQMLAFSRKQPLVLQPIHLNPLLRDMERMLSRVIGENILISLQLDADPDCILADAGCLNQVLMNLAVNARDAMPNGGTIHIGTSSLPEDHRALKAAGLQGRVYVCLTFADNGTGMNADVLAHVFEPFFTTKEPGKGTGLGLATVFGIVKQCDGHLSVESTPGQGTTFRLFFPLAQPSRPVCAPDRSTRSQIPLDHGTLLLTEDSPILRQLLRQFLEQRGYAVLAADSAETALALSRSPNQEIDLLITDVILPGMNGIDLYEVLHLERPDLPAIFMSGYSAEDIQTVGRKFPRAPFLAKPFNLADLAEIVRKNIKRQRT